MVASAGSADDQKPAFLFFSWTFYLILAAQVLVKAPVYLSTWGARELAIGTDSPFWIRPEVESAIYYGTSWILVLLCAAGFTGYLLRLFPPPAVGSALVSYLGAFAAATMTGAAFPFAAWVWGAPWSSGAWKGLFVWIAWLFYCAWNARRARTLDRRFVLFLRRFNGFADLALARAILRLSPRGTPMVLLVGSSADAEGIWDPMTLGEFGLRTALPFASRPLFLDGHDRWQAVVGSLIERSAVIVLDATEDSPAVQLEVELIDRLGKTGSVIQISKNLPERTGATDPAARRLATVTYRLSPWSLALPLGLTLAICLLLGRYADLWGQFAAAAARGELLGALFGGTIMIGALAVFLGALMLRRGLTRSSRDEVARALARGLAPLDRPSG